MSLLNNLCKSYIMYTLGDVRKYIEYNKINCKIFKKDIFCRWTLLSYVSQGGI